VIFFCFAVTWSFTRKIKYKNPEKFPSLLINFNRMIKKMIENDLKHDINIRIALWNIKRNKKMERALILSGGGARGAFQAGVWKFLQENEWEPDLICGSSVGAINAAAIGAGMNAEQMSNLWKKYDRLKLFSFTLKDFFFSFFSRKKFNPLMNTAPLKFMLTEQIDIEALQKSKAEILITAINMLTSQLVYFNHKKITVDHIMAATAIPMLFPWQYINGEPYWDGGFMANVPIAPALERGIKDIIVVLLSPVALYRQPIPQTHRQVADLIFEQFIVGSYNLSLSCLSCKNADIKIISPYHSSGFFSVLNFSSIQADRLIQDGYDNAKKELLTRS